MPYVSLSYHLIWTTREREPIVGPAWEPEVWTIISESAVRSGIRVHAIGGVPDHVHVAASIPPSLAVAEAVRRIKGGGSHAINQMTGGGFSRQTEYEVVSFAERHLPKVTAYIRDQHRHHVDQTIWPLLERLTDPDRSPCTSS